MKIGELPDIDSMQSNSMRKTLIYNVRSTLRFLVVISITLAGATTVSSLAADTPETVLVTFHVKRSKVDELKQLLWRSWATYQQLKLVLSEPHIIARSDEENGDVTFFELFSWKSHSIPDNAPTEVRTLWNQMEKLCAPRNGQSGINFVEVEILRPESSQPTDRKS